ncbi:hypothetical protein P4A93_12260 [Pseudomonas syringae pv. syringae]|uniref:hypothetical protein n=1 Tax=Pseudomonas syringae TaxID=317 RepID=UPI0023F84033|nr:hypothetical protein [Pseudomonas syringae]MDF5892401.1 hypothetical protein [Pseudomonas syringae pv. syringae]
MPLPDDPTAALLLRLNQNINALGAAIEEIGAWIDQRGSTEVYARIEQQIDVLHDNADFIADAMADLIVRCTSGGNHES